jgi:hypothetical protein
LPIQFGSAKLANTWKRTGNPSETKNVLRQRPEECLHHARAPAGLPRIDEAAMLPLVLPESLLPGSRRIRTNPTRPHKKMRINSFALLFITPLFLSGCVTTQTGRPVAAAKAAPVAWPWPDSMDAVSAAPRNHKVLYEDERVRILEVTVEPGEKENMHYHRWPSVLIVDSPAKKKEYTSDGKVTSTDRPSEKTPLPIIVRMGPTPPHAIENLDTNVLHLYRIEMKKIDAGN